jgi:cellulose/xylan binding protein with CBM9 domain
MLEGTKRRRSMRIASHFKRRSRPPTRLGFACAGSAWATCCLLGCFFQLDDVVLPGVGSGGTSGSDGAGAGGTSIGGAPFGGSGGDASPIICDLGFKDCGSGCVATGIDNGCGSASCAPCATPPHGNVTCDLDGNTCKFDSCDEGYADCDADTASYTGAVPGNGCEYPFAPAGELGNATVLPLDVPLATNIIVDDSRSDWAGIPTYPLIATCEKCFDNAFPDVIGKAVVPPRSDLEAYFRVAWNQDFFYLLGDVFDKTLFSEGASVGGQCQNGAPCEDGLTLFIDGHNNRATSAGYGNDDLRIFLGTSDTSHRVSNAQVQPQQLDFKTTVVGAACYRIEAKVSWAYIVATQNNTPIANLFPPAVGQEYGFDLSVNDWDLSASDETPQRESQLFWVSPVENYHQETSGFGPMRLGEAATAAGAPQ